MCKGVKQFLFRDTAISVLIEFLHQCKLFLLGDFDIDALKSLAQLVYRDGTIAIYIKLFHEGLHVIVERTVLLDTFPNKLEHVLHIDFLLADVWVFGVLLFGEYGIVKFLLCDSAISVNI